LNNNFDEMLRGREGKASGSNGREEGRRERDSSMNFMTEMLTLWPIVSQDRFLQDNLCNEL
jgi:hypothetical protein